MAVEFFSFTNPQTHAFFLWLLDSGLDVRGITLAAGSRDELAAGLARLVEAGVPEEEPPGSLAGALAMLGRLTIDVENAANALMKLYPRWTPESN